MARNLQGLCTCGTHLRMMLRASPPTAVSIRCLDPRLLQQFLLMMLRVSPPTAVSFLLDFSNFNFSSSPFDRQVSHSFFYSLNILHTTIHTQIFFSRFSRATRRAPSCSPALPAAPTRQLSPGVRTPPPLPSTCASVYLRPPSQSPPPLRGGESRRIFPPTLPVSSAHQGRGEPGHISPIPADGPGSHSTSPCLSLS